MSARPEIRLGTRASLLAIAQSRLVARRLENLDPGLRIQIVPMSSPGDRDAKTPLRQIQAGDFFSADIDAALLDGQVDFCVHSMKDLSPQRPDGIALAAVPERADPRDVVLFHDRVPGKLLRGQPIRIGSSSERRIGNVANFLSVALPGRRAAPSFEFGDIRGPVDERITRLHTTGEGGFDGVVLAMAGLQRLWSDAAGRARLSALLNDIRWMVLPLSRCATAPAQGALAVECRANDPALTSLLARIHDPATAECVASEQAIWTRLGRQTGLGVSAIRHPVMGNLAWLAEDGRNELRWAVPDRPERLQDVRPFDGASVMSQEPAYAAASGDVSASAVFVAHWRAVRDATDLSPGARVWVSGVASWRRLARQGIWVEGCGEGLGFASLSNTLRIPVLGLPPLNRWTVLTHAHARDSWCDAGVGQVVASYELPVRTRLDKLRSTIAKATHFYWGSARQFQAVRDWLPDGASHACGPGKTVDFLRGQGIVEPLIFPSRAEWRAWIP